MPSPQYNPLPDPNVIRLLRRMPLKFFDSDPSHYSFDFEVLKDDYGPIEPYSALSYTWGAQAEKITVRIDFLPFRITPTLSIALDTFFSTNPNARLWVDAICINQDDLKERDQQVRRMKTIYQRADMVFVYLGDTPQPLLNSNSELQPFKITNAWKLARYLSAISAVMHLDWGVDVLFRNAFLDLSKDPILADPISWKLLRRLFQDKWFERLCTYLLSTILDIFIKYTIPSVDSPSMI
jgi:hypothetical protein